MKKTSKLILHKGVTFLFLYSFLIPSIIGQVSYSLQCEFGRVLILDVRCNDNGTADGNDDRIEYIINNNGLSPVAFSFNTPAGTTLTSQLGNNFSSDASGSNHTLNSGIVLASTPSPNCSTFSINSTGMNTGVTCNFNNLISYIPGGSTYVCNGNTADFSVPTCIPAATDLDDDVIQFTVTTGPGAQFSITELPTGSEADDGSNVIQPNNGSISLQPDQTYTFTVPSQECADLFMIINDSCGNSVLAMTDPITASIPILSQWGIIILGISSLIIGLVCIRNEKRTNMPYIKT